MCAAHTRTQTRAQPPHVHPCMRARTRMHACCTHMHTNMRARTRMRAAHTPVINLRRSLCVGAVSSSLEPTIFCAEPVQSRPEVARINPAPAPAEAVDAHSHCRLCCSSSSSVRPIFKKILVGACRRRTPRTRVDLKVPTDASHRDLSDANPPIPI